MQQNKLFNQTRRRLALSYAGVMGFILTLLGVGVYEAIAHAHWVALDRELESVALTIQESLELKLTQPGHLEPIIYDLLPNLCQTQINCSKAAKSPQRGFLNAIKGNYYIRLFDTSGHLLAIGGNYPEGLQGGLNSSQWQTLSDNKGNTYRQISVFLHTQQGQNWGYFQVGRTFKDFEDYLNRVQWVLLLGLPLSLILIALASWWVAGLAMRPIYQSYQQIQQFTADAAHELRTPLAATQATVESALLISQLEEQEVRDILKTIERQNKRLIQLVADLMLLARMDQKSVSVPLQLCCLNDVVNDLVEELATLAYASHIALISQIRVEQPLEIMGNCEQLYRLVSNLMVNAIQYTPAGGKVTVILERSSNHAVIQVQDTGIGIAPSEQKRVFDRFYRVKSDRSRHTGGSGLGLAIALAIALVHQGSITIQSELDQGSIFTVKLPLTIPNRNAD